MQYAVPSGILYGGFMYYLGKLGVLDFITKNLQQQKPQIQEQVKEQKSQQSTQISTTTEKIVNNTFTDDAITPILRTFQINPKCKILYSTLHKTPLSVHQLLDLPTIIGDSQRAKYFHKDSNIIPSKFAVTNDFYLKTGAYKNFNYNRGHMAAASDFSSTQELKNSTFSFANTIPQNGYNNGGIWNTFERYCRSLLKSNKCDTIEIISGPIFYSQKKLDGKNGVNLEYKDVYKNEQIVLMKNGIVVPPRLYKIIKCNTKDKTYASGFTFYNEKTFDNDKTLQEFEEDIEQIQNQTGLVFNFKTKLNGKLSQYDTDLKGTKRKYDKQFYSQLFMQAKTIDDKNSALRRAYEQKISMEEEKDNHANLIQKQAEKQIDDLKNNKQISDCKRLSSFMELHKGLFYLGGEKGRFQSQSKRIESQVEILISQCKSTASSQQSSNLAYKVSRQSRKYNYPFSSLIAELFQRNLNSNMKTPELNKNESSTISQIPQVKIENPTQK